MALRTKIHSVVAVLLALLLCACSVNMRSPGSLFRGSMQTSDAGEAQDSKIVYVGPEQMACEADSTADCLQTRETPDGEWALQYESIAGFDYEPGYTYELRVMEQDAETRGGGSGPALSLLEVLSQEETTVAGEESSPSLIGTTWQLQEIEMMNGDVFTPDNPENYTLTISASGDVHARMDCNVGNGVYAVDGTAVTFSPLATTRVRCPEGSLFDLYDQGLSDANTYVIEDGRLHLAFGPDAGILVFAPAEE